MASSLDQVQDEIRALVGDKKRDDETSIWVYDPAAFNYRAVGGEKVVGCLDGVQRVEVRNTGRYFRGDRFWKSLMRGLLGRKKAYLIMGSPEQVAEKEQRVTATGQLIVTDKALAFEGDAKNERLTWQQIADVKLLADDVEISKRTGPPRTYAFTLPDPKFAAVLLSWARVSRWVRSAVATRHAAGPAGQQQRRSFPHVT
jgi:hypothetical protein